MKNSRSNDSRSGRPVTAGAADLSDVVGSWFNTCRPTGEIVRLEIDHPTGRRTRPPDLRRRGAGPDPLAGDHRDPVRLRLRLARSDRLRGPERLRVHSISSRARGIDTQDPAGFHAIYDFGLKQRPLAANVNKGFPDHCLLHHVPRREPKIGFLLTGALTPRGERPAPSSRTITY
jgi:hypothetical protein